MCVLCVPGTLLYFAQMFIWMHKCSIWTETPAWIYCRICSVPVLYCLFRALTNHSKFTDTKINKREKHTKKGFNKCWSWKALIFLVKNRRLTFVDLETNNFQLKFFFAMKSTNFFYCLDRWSCANIAVPSRDKFPSLILIVKESVCVAWNILWIYFASWPFYAFSYFLPAEARLSSRNFVASTFLTFWVNDFRSGIEMALECRFSWKVPATKSSLFLREFQLSILPSIVPSLVISCIQTTSQFLSNLYSPMISNIKFKSPVRSLLYSERKLYSVSYVKNCNKIIN